MMFVCAGCLQEFGDDRLAFTLLNESRLTHPARYFFERRFHSVECLLSEIGRLPGNYGPFVLSRANGDAREQVGEPMRARDMVRFLHQQLPANN